MTRDIILMEFKNLFKKSVIIGVSEAANKLQLTKEELLSNFHDWNKNNTKINVVIEGRIFRKIPSSWDRVKKPLKKAGKWALKQSIPVAIGIATGGIGLSAAVAPVVENIISYFRSKGLNVSNETESLVTKLMEEHGDNSVDLLQKMLEDDNRSNIVLSSGLNPKEISHLIQLSINETLPDIIGEVKDLLKTFVEQNITNYKELMIEWIEEQREFIEEQGQTSLNAHSVTLEYLNQMESEFSGKLSEISISLDKTNENIMNANFKLEALDEKIDRKFSSLCQTSLSDFSKEELMQASEIQFSKTRIASKMDIPFDANLFIKTPQLDIKFSEFLNQRNGMKPLFLLLAHMGMGKTWNAAHLGKFSRKAGVIPFFIPFNLGYNEQLKSIFNNGEAHSVSKVCDTIYSKQQFKILLIFDGLDEITDQEVKKSFLKFLQKILTITNKILILLTCRDTVWERDADLFLSGNLLKPFLFYNPSMDNLCEKFKISTDVGYFLDGFTDIQLKSQNGAIAKYELDENKFNNDLLELCHRPYILRLIRELKVYPDPKDGGIFIKIFYKEDNPQETILYRMGIVKDVEELFFDLILLFTDMSKTLPKSTFESKIRTKTQAWNTIIASGIFQRIKRGPKISYVIEPVFRPVIKHLINWINGVELKEDNGMISQEIESNRLTSSETIKNTDDKEKSEKNRSDEKSKQMKKYKFHIIDGEDNHKAGRYNAALKIYEEALSVSIEMFDINLKRETQKLIDDLNIEKEAYEKITMMETKVNSLVSNKNWVDAIEIHQKIIHLSKL